MRAFTVLTAAVLSLAAPVSAAKAQEQRLPFSPAATEACLSRAFDDTGCIGVSAEACLATPEGSSNVGMGRCYALEHAYWEGRLDRAYTALLEAGRASDEALLEGSQVPRQVPALQELQERWIGYRDAFCAFESSTWGGGTGAHVAHQQCLMMLTGLQTLVLEVGFELH